MRHREITPRLAGASFGEAHADNALLTAHWRMGDGRRLSLTANLGDGEIAAPRDPRAGTLIWGSALGDNIPAWSVCWHIG
jgi:maltooligosyltrehalose trehalohydrolase